MLENIKKNSIYLFIDRIGRKTVLFVEEFGYVFATLYESIYWLLLGKKKTTTR